MVSYDGYLAAFYKTNEWYSSIVSSYTESTTLKSLTFLLAGSGDGPKMECTKRMNCQLTLGGDPLRWSSFKNIAEGFFFEQLIKAQAHAVFVL